jgi:hypothetical protein
MNPNSKTVWTTVFFTFLLAGMLCLSLTSVGLGLTQK